MQDSFPYVADSKAAPMGWNSWDCYGTTVTESEVLANAQFMSKHLLKFGWNTIVVDIQWYEPNARSHGYNDNADLLLDGFGRQLPVPGRFPSAAPDGEGNSAGFTELAAKVHALGLKFGVHIMRGIPRKAVRLNLPILGTAYTAAEIANTDSTCAWNSDNYGLNHDHPGAQAYYDSQVAQLAAWGVAFIKTDDMLAPYHDREIAAYAQAIKNSGRAIDLSLSPGTHLSLNWLEHLNENATMWRVSNDLWDRWEDVAQQFGRMAQWAAHQRPGGYADADMLPLGRIGIRAERGEPRESRLSLAEQQTLMSLWTLAKSPLMFGGDLPSSSDQAIALLTNELLMEMFHTSEPARQIKDEGALKIWATRYHPDDPDAHMYVALFNTSDEELVAALDVGDLGRPRTDNLVATNIWTGQAHQVLGTGGLHEDQTQREYPQIMTTIAPHAVAHFKLTTNTKEA